MDILVNIVLPVSIMVVYVALLTAYHIGRSRGRREVKDIYEEHLKKIWHK